MGAADAWAAGSGLRHAALSPRSVHVACVRTSWNPWCGQTAAASAPAAGVRPPLATGSRGLGRRERPLHCPRSLGHVPRGGACSSLAVQGHASWCRQTCCPTGSLALLRLPPARSTLGMGEQVFLDNTPSHPLPACPRPGKCGIPQHGPLARPIPLDRASSVSAHWLLSRGPGFLELEQGRLASGVLQPVWVLATEVLGPREHGGPGS